MANDPPKVAKLVISRICVRDALRLTHENSAENQDLAVMVPEDRHHEVEERGSACHAEPVTEAVDSNLQWSRRIDSFIGHREEVQKRVEVHPCDKGSEEAHANGSLATEYLLRYHRLW